jgi:hypothetical protein
LKDFVDCSGAFVEKVGTAMDFKSTEQTISWFKDRYLEGSLVLKPIYQRNAVWLAGQKCWLVESVLKMMPIPEVFIQKITTETGQTKYSVVDGQQRIRALLQFVGSDSDFDQLEYDSFALDKLDVESPWFGMTFSGLKPSERISFFDYSLSVRYLNSDSDEDMKEMFRRINKFTLPLKPQELRNATYAGPFMQLCNRFADDYGDYFAENRIVGAAAIRRMSDVEFVAELLIGTLHGPQGGQPTAIDEYFLQYEQFEGEFPEESDARRLFVTTLEILRSELPDLRSTRWSNKTDFYSLFVAFARLIARKELRLGDLGEYSDRVLRFARDVDSRLEDEEAVVSREVAEYARNVVKGANDKARRAARHASLLKILAPS